MKFYKDSLSLKDNSFFRDISLSQVMRKIVSELNTLFELVEKTCAKKVVIKSLQWYEELSHFPLFDQIETCYVA